MTLKELVSALQKAERLTGEDAEVLIRLDGEEIPANQINTEIDLDSGDAWVTITARP